MQEQPAGADSRNTALNLLLNSAPAPTLDRFTLEAQGTEMPRAFLITARSLRLLSGSLCLCGEPGNG